VPGHPPIKLEAGDVLVLPHGDRYVMSNAPGMTSNISDAEILAFFRMLVARELPFHFPEGGGGSDRMRTLCGFLGCDALPFNPVFATLPHLFTIRRQDAVNDRLSHLFEFALAESREKAAGSHCVLLKISELMFVEVVRQYLASLPTDETGWLAGLRDPVVGKALGHLHERPAEAWTLESLARESGASRSALAERFTHFVGQPPMQYLTRWRLQLAAGRLAQSDAKVSAVALDVGYDSEAAFSRAFKKMVGVPPSAWRRRHRD
jgi:AraC-like DNA-binding protein